MGDMGQVIIPKSDQLNADDLIAGPITIRIADVSIRGGQEQPISVHYEGDNGKPYKPCKSMCRIMVTAWGADSKKYVGRSMTLYRDPGVKWAGMEVGGIRVSHMSDIKESLTMALTVTRANKKPFTVRPLAASGAQPQKTAAPASVNPPSPTAVGASDTKLDAAAPPNQKTVAQQGEMQHAGPLTGSEPPIGKQRDAVTPAAAAAPHLSDIEHPMQHSKPDAPSDDELAKSIATLVAGGDYDLAADLARGFSNVERRANALRRIEKARNTA